MTEHVLERQAWTELVATHVDPQTKAALTERAHEEMTSVSSVMRRAIAAHLERGEHAPRSVTVHVPPAGLGGDAA